MTLDLFGSRQGLRPVLSGEVASSADLSSLLNPLLERATASRREELLALGRESDAGLFLEGLLNLGQRALNSGQTEFAADVFSAVAASRAEGTLAARAQRELDAIVGRGAIGGRLEFLGRNFVSEAADPVTLAAMTTGSLVFSLSRGAILSRLLSSPARNLLTTGIGARALASAGAFLFEVPAFWATGKGLREVLAPGSQRWDLATNLHELAGAGLTLGALKLTGYASQSLFRRMHGLAPFEVPASLGLRFSQSVFHQAGMLGGILIGNRLETLAGLRRPVDGATTLVDSLVTLLQFHVGGRLSSSLMGEAWTGRLQALESRLDRLEPRLSRDADGPSRPLGPALAWAGANSVPEGRGHSEISEIAARPLFIIGEGGDRLDKIPEAVPLRTLLRDVADRGKEPEVRNFRVLLQEILQQGGARLGYTRLLEKFDSRDHETWRDAIRILGDLLERDASLVGRMRGSASFQEFGEDWRGRPHFRTFGEVPAHVAAGTPKIVTIQRHLVDLQRAIAQDPTLRGWESFARPKIARGEYSRVHAVADSEGGKRVFANWKAAGLELAFDARGNFIGKIEVRRPYADSEWADLGKAPPALDATKVAPLRPSQMGQQAGESPTHWALRLIDASRSEENALEIARALAERLEHPDSAPATREMIDRMVPLTSSLSEGSSILVRRYAIPHLNEPLTIVSLPSTFLPEQWSRVFAEGIVQDFRQHRQAVNRAIEIGSGTGWVSILLGKLGMAREVVGLDRNPQAPVVGRLNAALNGVSGVRFETGDLLSKLPEGFRADLIVACLPQVPANGGISSLRAVADYYSSDGTYWDRFGLGLIDRALTQSRDRLNSGGRVLFNLGGRPGRPVLEALLEQHGLHPSVRYGQLIRQDPTTDFSALARLEESGGKRFEFFLKEDPATPISAAEAVGRREVYHMLYLTEGRPYDDLARTALATVTQGAPRWGYTQEPGTENEAFREVLAPELSRQWGARIPPESLFIGPSADLVLETLLRVILPEQGKVVYSGTPDKVSPAGLRGFNLAVQSPDFNALRGQLEANRPDALVLRLPPEAWQQGAELSALLHSTAERQVHVVVLEDHPAQLLETTHPFANYIAYHPDAAPNLHIIQSLDRRYGQAALPLGVGVIGNSAVQGLMARYADLSYSRSSSLIQEIYRSFFTAMPRTALPASPLEHSISPMLTNFEQDSPVIRALSSRSAFESGPQGHHPDPIDMSFGESEWRAPVDLGPALLGATQGSGTKLYAEAQLAVANYLQQSRGVSLEPESIVLGAGVQPLIEAAIRGISAAEGGKTVQVAVPRPSYGLFFPTIELAGGRRLDVPTGERERFLVSPGQLSLSLSRQGSLNRSVSALLINEPSNPSGQYYGATDLQNLALALGPSQGYLLFDDVFGMLDFGRIRGKRPPSLQVLQRAIGPRLVAFGGLSKEFGAGGLRFGFAVSPNARLVSAIREQVRAAPDPLALAAAPSYLTRWKDLVSAHRQDLSARARRLEEVFRERNIPTIGVQGGYTMFVDLRPLYNRKLRLRGGGQAEIGPKNLHNLLYTETGIRLHGPDWAGIPDHYRFVFSIARLDEAIDRLKGFFRAAR